MAVAIMVIIGKGEDEESRYGNLRFEFGTLKPVCFWKERLGNVEQQEVLDWEP